MNVEPVLSSQAERDADDYSRTPAGMVRAALGVVEERRPHEAAELMRNTEVEFRARRGRDMYDSERRAFERLAEQRTTVISQLRKLPSTTWDIAQMLRWGVDSPPPNAAALAVEPQWFSLPPAG